MYLYLEIDFLFDRANHGFFSKKVNDVVKILSTIATTTFALGYQVHPVLLVLQFYFTCCRSNFLNYINDIFLFCHPFLYFSHVNIKVGFSTMASTTDSNY